MKLIPLNELPLAAISRFSSQAAASTLLAESDDGARVHLIRFEPGGLIDRHPTGFRQWFFALEGEGWVSGEDGERQMLRRGFAAEFAVGEMHAKGSDLGMTALMVQLS